MFRQLILSICLLTPIFIQAQEIDLLILNQDYQKALQVIDAKLDQQPTGSLYLKKCVVHKQLMDYPLALADINAALSIDPLNLKYLGKRADLFQSMGNYSNAVSDFQAALAVNPTDLQLKYDLGKALLYLNDYKRAYETYEEIQAVDSTNLMFNKYSALAAYKAHKYKRAIHLYENYLPQNPDDISAYINISDAFVKIHKAASGLSFLDMAHQRFPKNAAVHLNLANTAFENKEYQMAQREYQSYLAEHDTVLPVFRNYGICLYHNKHTAQALEVLEACYFDNPNDTYINFYLGVCHKRLGNYDLAAPYLEYAIFVSIPEFHPEMYHHLAQVYRSLKNYEKAIQCYKKAFELDSRKVEVLFEIATTYEEYNFNKTLALNYYQSYLKTAGEDAHNAYYALDRIKKIKEELFFEK